MSIDMGECGSPAPERIEDEAIQARRAEHLRVIAMALGVTVDALERQGISDDRRTAHQAGLLGRPENPLLVGSRRR